MSTEPCQYCHRTDGAHLTNCPININAGRHIPGEDATRVYRDSITGDARPITPHELDVLRLKSDRQFSDYELTGVQVIDDLLCAIAWASDWLHDSTRWGEEVDISSYGPLRRDENFSDLIQSLATDGANEIRKALL